ncbi:hypothetical protein NDU88_004539 [Pleurodeles waltl]|uniref:Uncharacterized protein n=1 Tax=Pleurodeles waltl TaxID=8319 RepID=A0AAV7SJ17_PLEWA|nr:hypothetical protein NDU88_004539 [Pleurodeles waltl]
MAPKSVRSVTDKTESVPQARLAKEGSDGHATGKRALGGSKKIVFKINARAVRDGKDQLRSAQPDNKPKDKLQKAASSGYDLNDEDGSGSSEAESLAERMSPVMGPTVRPQRRHHKCIMSRTGSGGVMDSPVVTLKWDYSGIRLSHSEKSPQAPSDTALTLNLTANENCPGEHVNNMPSSETKILQLIYGTVRELQTETQAENRKARVATKQL